jgi:Zn finger protein HypA/HybF involved in hydrogenase expression
MSYEKTPTAEEGDVTLKVRKCLSCQTPFQSAWSGERVCPKCKTSSSWRAGTPRNSTASRRS